jgi:prepilin signal peptidase PulO-like enzyme (type II secretory pathway)
MIDTFFYILSFLIIIAIGAIFGSYATLFAYRLPRKESVFGRYFGKKSRCGNCQAIIPTIALVPLLNWIVTRGKCLNCHSKISKIHLCVELSTIAMFLATFIVIPFGELWLLFALLGTCLVIISATDYSHKHFPDNILAFIATLATSIHTLKYQNISDIVINLLFAIVVISILYRIFVKKTLDNYFIIANIVKYSDRQFFSYIKLLLIIAIVFSPLIFASYLLCAIFLLSTIIILNKKWQKKLENNNSISIAPFLNVLFYLILLINNS